MTVIDLGFPTHYELELISQLPTEDSQPQFWFSAAVSGGISVGLTLRVTTTSHQWIGTFALGGYKPSGLTGVFALPDPERFCVIAEGAGYLVQASDPDKWDEIEMFPIIEARVLRDHRLLIVADFTTMAAYGSKGFAWRTDRISWDGVRIIASEGDELWARVWDAPGDEETMVAVNLRTGTHRGGAAPPQNRDPFKAG